MPIFLKRFLEADQPQPAGKGANPPSQGAPAAAPTTPPQPPQEAPKQDQKQSSGQGNTYNLGFDLEDFQKKLSQATETVKNEFKEKILSQIANQKIQFRASKGYGQPEKDYIVNVDDVSIDFYYENYVVVIKGREPNKQKQSEYFIKYPYTIKKLGAATVPSKKKDTVAPTAPVPTPTQNVATKGI